MSEPSSPGPSAGTAPSGNPASGGRRLLGKAKVVALIALGASLLWVLVCNLFADDWKLRLTPFRWLEVPGPATLFIFLFLLVGALAGFLLCFLWLRGDRLREAMIYLLQDPRDAGARGALGSAEPAKRAEPEASKAPETGLVKPWKPILDADGGPGAKPPDSAGPSGEGGGAPRDGPAAG
ncbi:MAG: hypothetical protein MUC63_07650 [Planctomycetes bacterium]|jgi:hypothetical protein|nr:hypothetical protein [Planctomycetota bacterium]